MINISRLSALAAALALAACGEVPEDVAAPEVAHAACLDDDRAAQLIALRSDTVTAYISPMDGGQVVGLSLPAADGARELLYRGMNFCPIDGFDGKAPTLWPATGRSFGAEGLGTWSHKGEVLEMPVHGFARDLPWDVISPKDSGEGEAATVRLVDTAQTREWYPFGFAFDITYRVLGDTLTIEHRILADEDNGEAMPMALGNHITFALPDPDRARGSSNLRRQLLLEGGRPTGELIERTSFQDVPVTEMQDFGVVALAYEGGVEPTFTLDLGDGTVIDLAHKASQLPQGDPVAFNLWPRVQDNLFAPEPWLGKQDALNTGDGLVMLAPGEELLWRVTVAIAAD